VTTKGPVALTFQFLEVDPDRAQLVPVIWISMPAGISGSRTVTNWR